MLEVLCIRIILKEFDVASIEDRMGHLFVLEGIDGAGKTAVCERLIKILGDAGHDVVHLREPTSESQWGKEIRSRSPNGELTPAEELDLFLKDREWHIMNKICPALSSGKIVIMDRYFFATGAYQSVSTGISWREILRRNREEIHAPEPDLIFILDLPAEEGLARVRKSREEIIEQFEQIDRLVKVRQAYLEMAQYDDKGSYVLIDARLPLETVVDIILGEILDHISS